MMDQETHVHTHTQTSDQGSSHVHKVIFFRHLGLLIVVVCCVGLIVRSIGLDILLLESPRLIGDVLPLL